MSFLSGAKHIYLPKTPRCIGAVQTSIHFIQENCQKIIMIIKKRCPIIRVAIFCTRIENLTRSGFDPLSFSYVMSAPFARKRPFEEADRLDPSLQESLALLKSVVGQDVSDSRLLQLLKGCKGDVQLAANAYFSSQTSASAAAGQPAPPTASRAMKYIGNVLLSGKPQPYPQCHAMPRYAMP